MSVVDNAPTVSVVPDDRRMTPRPAAAVPARPLAAVPGRRLAAVPDRPLTAAPAQRLAAVAARQYGLFTRAQARQLGYSAFQVRQRLRTGDWRVLLGSVLAFAGVADSAQLRDRAAQL